MHHSNTTTLAAIVHSLKQHYINRGNGIYSHLNFCKAHLALLTQCRTPHQILHSLSSCQGPLSAMFPQYTMLHPTPDITLFVFLSRPLVSNVSTAHNGAPHTRYYILCLPVKAPCQQCFHSTQCCTPHQILHSLSSCQGPLSAMFPQHTMVHPTPDITFFVFLSRPLVSNVSTAHQILHSLSSCQGPLSAMFPQHTMLHPTPDITLFVFLSRPLVSNVSTAHQILHSLSSWQGPLSAMFPQYTMPHPTPYITLFVFLSRAQGPLSAMFPQHAMPHPTPYITLFVFLSRPLVSNVSTAHNGAPHTRYYILCLPVKAPCQQCFHSTQCRTPHQILHSLSSCQGPLSAMFPQHTMLHPTPDITLVVFLSRPLVSNVSTAHNAAPHTRYYTLCLPVKAPCQQCFHSTQCCTPHQILHSLSSCQGPLSAMFPQHTMLHPTPDITLFVFLSRPLVSNVSTAHNAAPHSRYYTLCLPVKAPCQQCFHSTQCCTSHQILHSLSSCQGSLSAMFPQHTMPHPTPDITLFVFLSRLLVSNVSTAHNAAPHTRYYTRCLPVKAPCQQCFHSTQCCTPHQILHSLSSCQGPLSAMFPQHTMLHPTPDITLFVFLSRPLVSNVSTAHNAAPHTRYYTLCLPVKAPCQQCFHSTQCCTPFQILHSLSSCQGSLSAMFPQYTMLYLTPDITLFVSLSRLLVSNVSTAHNAAPHTRYYTLCLPVKAPCQQCFHSTQCCTPHQILHSLSSCQGSLSAMFPQHTMPHPTPDITLFVFLSRPLVSNVSTAHNAAPHTRYYTLCLPVKAPCQQCFHSTQCCTPHQILHSLSSCQGPLSAMFPQYTMLHPTPDITLFVFLPRPLVSNVSTVHNAAPHTRYYTLCLPVKAPCQQCFHSTHCCTPHQILHSLSSCQSPLSAMFPQHSMLHPTPDITLFVFLSRLLVSNVSTVHTAAPHTRYYTLCLPVKAPCQQCFHSIQCCTPHQILHSLSSCQGSLSAMFPQYTMLHPTPDITLFVFLSRPLVSNVSTAHNAAPHTRYYTLCLPVKAPCQQCFHSTPDITLCLPY